MLQRFVQQPPLITAPLQSSSPSSSRPSLEKDTNTFSDTNTGETSASTSTLNDNDADQISPILGPWTLRCPSPTLQTRAGNEAMASAGGCLTTAQKGKGPCRGRDSPDGQDGLFGRLQVEIPSPDECQGELRVCGDVSLARTPIIVISDGEGLQEAAAAIEQVVKVVNPNDNSSLRNAIALSNIDVRLHVSLEEEVESWQNIPNSFWNQDPDFVPDYLIREERGPGFRFRAGMWKRKVRPLQTVEEVEGC